MSTQLEPSQEELEELEELGELGEMDVSDYMNMSEEASDKDVTSMADEYQQKLNCSPELAKRLAVVFTNEMNSGYW